MNASSAINLKAPGLVVSKARFFSVILCLVLISSLVFAGLSVFTGVLLSQLPLIRISIFGFLLLSVFRPDISLPLALFLLPLTGNKPGSGQLLYLIFTQSALVLGLFLRLLIFEREKIAEVFWPSRLNMLLFLALLYVIISALSLLSLPLSALLSGAVPKPGSSGAIHLASSIMSFLRLREDKVSYSLLSVMLSGLSFVSAYFIYCRAEANPVLLRRLGFSILLGLVVSLVAGVLDYYLLIDLRNFRGLDPLVNPGNLQFRLQSFFGHSGWYAEYVTLAIPFVIMLLSLKLPYYQRVLLILLILLLGEFVLILTFQRGGWVSYPLTLFVVWAAVYVTKKLDNKEANVLLALKRSLVKVLFSIPLTVALSLGVIWLCLNTGILKSDTQVTVGAYINRFSDIRKTSDRTDFMLAGWLLGLEHPFLGAGADSFCYKFHSVFERPEGKHYQRLVLPLHGTAHNVYFQTFSGKGVAGVAILLCWILYMVVPALRIVFGPDEYSNKSLPRSEERILVLSTLAFACSFLIYGMVQEIFYIRTLEVLFFAVSGMFAALAGQALTVSRREEKLIWIWLIFFTVAQLLYR